MSNVLAFKNNIKKSRGLQKFWVDWWLWVLYSNTLLFFVWYRNGHCFCSGCLKTNTWQINLLFCSTQFVMSFRKHSHAPINTTGKTFTQQQLSNVSSLDNEKQSSGLQHKLKSTQTVSTATTANVLSQKVRLFFCLVLNDSFVWYASSSLASISSLLADESTF